MPWASSMARSCGGHHGHPMELHGGVLLDGWNAMGIFHGKVMRRSPWASHGIAWGSTPGWVECHGHLPWQGHAAVTMGIPWNCMGEYSWMGGMPWASSMARSCGGHHGHPMELHGGVLLDGWNAMGIFHGKVMRRSPWASHGIAWGSTPGWVECHGHLPWQGHAAVTMGIP